MKSSLTCSQICPAESDHSAEHRSRSHVHVRSGIKKRSKMLFTEHHVLLNFPKTGSTWTRKVMQSQGNSIRKKRLFLSRKSWPENWWYEHLVRRESPNRMDQHGTRREMEAFLRKFPFSRINLPNQSIITNWRDPFELFSSSYRYQWWNHWPSSRKLDAQSRFPAFPQWEARHFYQYQKESQHLDFDRENEKTITILKSLGINWLGIKIILFYGSNALINEINSGKFHNDEIVFDAFCADVQEVTFLKQADLTTELTKTLKFSNESKFPKKMNS